MHFPEVTEEGFQAGEFPRDAAAGKFPVVQPCEEPADEPSVHPLRGHHPAGELRLPELEKFPEIALVGCNGVRRVVPSGEQVAEE